MAGNTDSSQDSRARRIAFPVIAALLPVMFFALLELALRAAGIGDHYPLFIDHPQHQGYRLANPEVIKRFFGHPDRAPGMQIETVFFRATKPANGLRLVVQGGSSAAGFPYGLGASPTGMLEQRLRRVYPNREIEVISTAMSAVNSYTLLDFADEIVEIEPDAVLIYAGHNEYLGILGVGSAYLGGHSRALTRAYLALRELHLFQLLHRMYLAIAPAPEASTADEAQAQGTMMSRIAANKNIVYGSPVYRQGLRQFRQNLEALIATYSAAGIPVFVATLASNERDQPPFVSGLAGGTDSALWQAKYREALRQAEAGSQVAVTTAQTLVEMDSNSADAHFVLGRAALASAQHDRARSAFQAARDRDELRFRAPGDFNDIIASMAGSGVTVVDVERALRAESPHGILGEDMLLEHVHPTLRGYFLLADAFFDALTDSDLVGAPVAAVDDAQAWQEVPVSEVDRLFGEYKVALIRANWPFTETAGRPELPQPVSVPDRLAQQLYRQTTNWLNAHRQLAEYYRTTGDGQNFLRVALILADAFPFHAPVQYEAGVALIAEQRSRQAINYLYRGAKLAPGDVDMLLALSHALVLNRAKGPAVEVLQRVLAIDPDNATALGALSRLQASP